jgi:hypothetical protein
MTKLPNN